MGKGTQNTNLWMRVRTFCFYWTVEFWKYVTKCRNVWEWQKDNKRLSRRSTGEFQQNGRNVQRYENICMTKLLHFPMERTENIIMMICDLELMLSLGLFGWADRVSNPSETDQVYISSKSASRWGLRLRWWWAGSTLTSWKSWILLYNWNPNSEHNEVNL